MQLCGQKYFLFNIFLTDMISIPGTSRDQKTITRFYKEIWIQTTPTWKLKLFLEE